MKEKERNFNFWFILNWRDGDVRVRKTKPDDRLNPYELPVEVDLDVLIPARPEIKAEGKISIGEDQLRELNLTPHLIEQEEEDEKKDITEL